MRSSNNWCQLLSVPCNSEWSEPVMVEAVVLPSSTQPTSTSSVTASSTATVTPSTAYAHIKICHTHVEITPVLMAKSCFF